jgi:hypothetical protein
MKSTVIALAIVLIGALCACTESFDLTLSYRPRAVPQRALTIDNIQGGVRLTRAAPGAPIAGTVKIHAAGFKEKSDAKLAAEAVTIAESLEGGELVLTVQIPAQHRDKTFAVTFDLAVPDDLIVAAFTDNGRVSVNGLIVGEIDTTRGEIDLAFTASPPNATTLLRTNDGRVIADAHQGPLDVATSNAPVELFSVAGSTRVTTTQGPIIARILPPRGGEVFLATTNAPIDLALPRDFGARLLAVTSNPGAVFVSDLNFRPTGSFPNQAEGILGDGAGRVDVRTIAAGIAIHR